MAHCHLFYSFSKKEKLSIFISFIYITIIDFFTYNWSIIINNFNSLQNSPISYTLTFNMGQNGLDGKRRMKSAPGYNIPYELFLISDAGEIFIEQEPIKFAGHTLAQWIIFYRAGATSA